MVVESLTLRKPFCLSVKLLSAILISFLFFFFCFCFVLFFWIIQSQAAFVNCLYVARFTIVHSKTKIKFPLLLLLLLLYARQLMYLFWFHVRFITGLDKWRSVQYSKYLALLLSSCGKVYSRVTIVRDIHYRAKGSSAWFWFQFNRAAT